VVEHERTTTSTCSARAGTAARGETGHGWSPLPAATAKRLRRHIRTRPADTASDRLSISLRRGRRAEYEPLRVSGLEYVVRELARHAGIARRVWPHTFRHRLARISGMSTRPHVPRWRGVVGI
jgi:hypothetical protein